MDGLQVLQALRQERVTAPVLLLTVLLAGSGGWLLARRALRPVDQMTTVVLSMLKVLRAMAVYLWCACRFDFASFSSLHRLHENILILL